MRIAFILPSLAKTGPIIVAHNIIKNICDELVSIDVYYFKNIVELEFNVKTFRIKLSSKIDFDKYDIIHSHMLKPDYYVWKYRKLIKTKCISTLHQFVYPSLRNDYNAVTAKVITPLWYKFLSRQDRIICVSGSLKRQFESNILKQKSVVINNGIEVHNEISEINSSEKAEILKFKSRYKLIGIFSKFTQIKGIDQLLKFLALNKEYALLLIGEGKSLPTLKKQAEKLNVKDRCIFLGRKNEVLSYYKYLDAYAMPSRFEGFGLTLIEAVSQKVPVVCSDISVFRELFNDSELTYFKLDDIDSLSSAFDFSIEHKDQLTTEALKKFSSNYTAKIMAAKYLDLYRNLQNG